MPFNPKEAAETLLKLADTLEHEALENSFFVCDKCNHTANLTTINERRKLASESNNVKKVSTVTVNEKVACPACDGVMSYVPTEKSQRYYIESAEAGPLEIAPPTNNPSDEPPPPLSEEKKDKPKKDYGDFFSPVDERGKDEELNLDFGGEGDQPEGMAPEGVPSGESKPEEGKIEESKPEELPPPEGVKPEELPPPEGEKPEELPPPDGEKTEELPPPEGEMPPVMEEEVPGEKPKKKKKKEDVEFPKEDVPKFEKMPKEAADMDYQLALRKYTF